MRLNSRAEDINKIDAGIESFTYHDTVDREYSGLGGRIGVLAFAGENVTLGATVTLPVNLEISEVWELQEMVGFDNGQEVVEGDNGSILYDI